MANNSVSEAISMQEGYYRTKFPATNKGHSFSHEDRAKLGIRGLYPGGSPFTLEQKVEVSKKNRYFICSLALEISSEFSDYKKRYFGRSNL